MVNRILEMLMPGTQACVDSGKCPTCKHPIMGFRDALSYKEFTMSGLCQECQDGVFK